MRQVRNNTIRNCLPYRPDIDWDMRNFSWEANGKQIFFKYASDITLSNNRCITQPDTLCCTTYFTLPGPQASFLFQPLGTPVRPKLEHHL